jgi:hypothetical protein
MEKEEDQSSPFPSLYEVLIAEIKGHPIYQSMYLNYPFYLTLLVCVLLIAYYSESNFFWAIFTIVFISAAGYFSHYISHHINAQELFHRLDEEGFIPQIPYIKPFILFFCKMLDFHDEIHHDTSINKELHNVATEFALNFYVQAGAFIVLFYIAKQMNLYVITLWGLMYATIHNINYYLFPSNTHVLHHVDKTTNYGIDIWDIIFRTKFEGDMSNEKLENINHYAINTIILTAIILLVMNVKISVHIGLGELRSSSLNP